MYSHGVDHWYRVGRNADFVEGKGRAVNAGGERVAVFRAGGRLHALQDACPHMRASLADGRIEDGRRVICHMHGWTFDLRSGEPAGGRSNCARVYPVENRGEEVWVRVELPHGKAGPREPDDDGWIPWSDEFLRSKKKG
ncbi:MAG: Rieske (2Fe-2S) protein [Candidatus Eiseniibacteriota bacterium]